MGRDTLILRKWPQSLSDGAGKGWVWLCDLGMEADVFNQRRYPTGDVTGSTWFRKLAYLTSFSRVPLLPT